MIKYPNGSFEASIVSKKEKKIKVSIKSASNRGMGLEHDINLSNEYYKNNGVALITKRTTPINVVKVDYTHGARITDAYFEKQSTTDYNGVYKGRYIDFEAKSTFSKTSFPIHNIYVHQINHLENVLTHDGIAFFIISFEKLNEIYLLDASYVIDFFLHGERKSIPYLKIKEAGTLVKQGFDPRIDYIACVEAKYFNS